MTGAFSARSPFVQENLARNQVDTTEYAEEARRLRPGYNGETPIDQLVFLIHTIKELFREEAFPNNLELLKVLTVIVSSPMLAQQLITLQMLKLLH